MSNHKELACEIVAALMKKDRTASELCEMTGAHTNTMCVWIRELRASGLIFMTGRRADENTGFESQAWAWQSKPFECEDIAA